ncbi:zinc-finger-containing protein, partial [Burkholderia pseudomallei]
RRLPTPRRAPSHTTRATPRLARVGDDAYPYREDPGELWICPPCDAWIGVFPRRRRHVPLGRLANAELRHAKTELHA